MIEIKASDIHINYSEWKIVHWNFQGRLKPPKPPLHDAPAGTELESNVVLFSLLVLSRVKIKKNSRKGQIFPGGHILIFFIFPANENVM